MKTCIVTGGAGFIGSHIVDRLIKENYKVIILDDLSTGKKKNINSKAKFCKINIQSSKIEEVFKKEKPDVLFHCAANIDVRKSVSDPIFDAKINILGSLNLLENCRKYGVKQVIFTSTGGAIYGDAGIIPTPESYPAKPISPYGVAKLSIEHYLHYYHIVHKISYTVLRFSNVYGPRQDPLGEAGVIAIFINNLMNNKSPIIYGDGKQTRDFVFVYDVVNAVMKVFKKKAVGIFNIGTGKETSVINLFEEIKKVMNSNIKVKKESAKLGEQKKSSLMYKKASKILNWKPQYSLKEGLRNTVKWFKYEASL